MVPLWEAYKCDQYTVMCQIKVHRLKKIHKFMGNLDIDSFLLHFNFSYNTCNMDLANHEWEDISKPSNINNIIKLFTILHIVAKQPIKIAKKPLVCSFWWLPWLQGINFRCYF